VEGFVPDVDWRRGYRDIVDFEHTLADDGTLIIKFFLHISRKEQKKRFKRLLQDPLSAWKVEPEDWEHHAKYDEYVLAIEEMLERTDTEWGPWTIVEATDRRHTRLKIFETIVTRLEDRLDSLDKLPDDYSLAMKMQSAAQHAAELAEQSIPKQTLPVETPSETQDSTEDQEKTSPADKVPRKSRTRKLAAPKKQPAAQEASLEKQEK
jgi:exonuclease VII small subunit